MRNAILDDWFDNKPKMPTLTIQRNKWVTEANINYFIKFAIKKKILVHVSQNEILFTRKKNTFMNRVVLRLKLIFRLQ